ncbi:MAG: hypothetical protein Q8S73_32990 [Deltaproteobacteria bacterium]|nr:hypothetical protein [Myxococcales bacterium]MDP3218962.1 hypothetical protein [Deltaproteobacteria bacterium]
MRRVEREHAAFSRAAQQMVAPIDGRQEALVVTQARVHLRLGSP